ncbi:hypothetical protein CR956_00610, partial [Candidatus Saccharibacteria bacterium]
ANTQKLFKGGILDIVSNNPLKRDSNNLSNILVFGTSEDDTRHDAPYLTDSMMVISLDQDNKLAYTFSIPRDLWVDYGRACLAGYKGRINSLYQCYSNEGKNESAGADALKSKVSEVTGLDIQYYAHVNYTVVRDLVKAVDGITIEIEGNGADGIMDSTFDWRCGRTLAERVRKCPPNGHFIEYKNGPAHLDAEHALRLATARGSHGATYGLAGSNFDREKNQQKIAIALKEKALSIGTLTDFNKITSLMNALGDNLRTNFEISEIRTLVSLGQDVTQDKIKRISLVDADPAIFSNANIGGASVLTSSSGMYNYDAMISYIKDQIKPASPNQEEAKMIIYNSSDVPGLAKIESNKLSEFGYIEVVKTGNISDAGAKSKYKLYADKNKVPETTKKLEEIYGVKALGLEDLPNFNEEANLVLVVSDAG